MPVRACTATGFAWPLGIFGSLVDPFMVPLEDLGGERGVDRGKGGKILITPPYDRNFFRLLNEYVQTEAHKPIDAPFIENLSEMGIANGKSFTPDDFHAHIATELEEALQADFRDVGDRFSPMPTGPRP